MLLDDSSDSSEGNGLFWLPTAHKNRTNPSFLHQRFHLSLAFSESWPRQTCHKTRVWRKCIINLLGPMGKQDLNAVQYGPSMWQVFILYPPTSHCHFTIQKTPITGGGWNTWMLQTLSTGCLYHHFQNQCTRNESFWSSRIVAGIGTCCLSPFLVLSKDYLDFLWEWCGIWDLAVKDGMMTPFRMCLCFWKRTSLLSHNICEINKWIW